MSSSSVECGTHLSTSRINRLLRPLRNKCTSLALLPKPETASRVTYSKQQSNWDPDSLPPLTVFRTAAGTKKFTLDRRSADEFELARRIHAVCDAFRNIVHVAFGGPCNDRIPTLGAMCTLVIGQSMPITNDNGASNDSDEEESAEENDNILVVVDGIYEAVPPHYRRFSIVSHALSMILCICPHHHTLVNLLLDHCLVFRLVHESTRLLDIILSQALLPSNPSCPPPVTHPAHATYLLDLNTKWANGNRAPGLSSGLSLFTASAFARGVLCTLSRCAHPNGHIIWTSKVFHRFLRMLETSDIDSYIYAIHTLSRDFWEISGSSLDASLPESANAEVLMLKDQLSEWMSSLFDLLFLREDSSPLAQWQIQAVVEVLADSHTAGLHTLRIPTPRSPINLPDIIIVFATHIFATFPSPAVDPNRLLSILDDSNPIPSTFAKLMSYLSRPQATQIFDSFVVTFLSDLSRYSSALRSQKLFRLDASLWACALRHFETSTAGSLKGNSATVTRYKQQLMEAVDAAERRCFGGDLESSPFARLSTQVDRVKRTRRGRQSGHWEWEEMVGSWIRKTPVHKKRKVDGDALRSPLHDQRSRPNDTTAEKSICAKGSTSVSTPSSSRHRRSSTFSPSSSFSQFSDPESHTEDDSEYQDETDKENHPTQPRPASKTSRTLRRHSSNFLSLLADAQMNRIVLHSKLQPQPKPPESFSVIPQKYVLPPSPPNLRPPSRKQEQRGRHKHQSPPRLSRQVDSVPLLPSDDSLNLFACATSSPAGC